jgi:hypothetical protein
MVNKQTAGAIAPVPSPFDSFIMGINGSPYFIGFMMLMLNLGGRFIGLELTQGQEKFLQNVWVRRVLIFIVLFMGTRNVLVAFWMWLGVVFLLGYVLNENSSMCIFGSGLPGSKCAASTGGSEGFVSPLTPEENEILSKLQQKAAKGGVQMQVQGLGQGQGQPQVTIQQFQDKNAETSEKDHVATYLENMETLRSMNDNPRF